MKQDLATLKLDLQNLERQLSLHPETSGIYKHLLKEATKLKKQIKKLNGEG